MFGFLVRWPPTPILAKKIDVTFRIIIKEQSWNEHILSEQEGYFGKSGGLLAA